MDYANMSPAEVRQLIRDGKITGQTSGMCDGYAQGNLLVLPMEQAYDFVTAHDITLSYDDSFGQNVGTSSDSEARYSIWMEDEQSVTNKINLIRQKELAGVAAWRIGFEKASVWSIITGGLE